MPGISRPAPSWLSKQKLSVFSPLTNTPGFSFGDGKATACSPEHVQEPGVQRDIFMQLTNFSSAVGRPVYTGTNPLTHAFDASDNAVAPISVNKTLA